MQFKIPCLIVNLGLWLHSCYVMAYVKIIKYTISRSVKTKTCKYIIKVKIQKFRSSTRDSNLGTDPALNMICTY